MTGATLSNVPNAPKTPKRTVRVPDELWAAAKAKAEERGEELSTVIRAALERYVKRSGGTHVVDVDAVRRARVRR